MAHDHNRRPQRARDAHTEVRELLEGDPTLCRWGASTRLIGSYARDTGRYPGKDVDVFIRLTELDTSATPKEVYEQVRTVLVGAYGDATDGGRAGPQARSVKVDFPDEDNPAVEFSVDAVPAVVDGTHWAIPTKDQSRWQNSTGRWVTTDPIGFADLSSTLSTASWSPAVAGRNAYKPVVKLLKQVRHVHLGDARPRGLFTEVAAYDVWNSGQVIGTSWAVLLAQTLRQVAQRFQACGSTGLPDPVLLTAMQPDLDPQLWLDAGQVFTGLADDADTALQSERCAAAAIWRRILGQNERGQVLPLPEGCDANGFPISQISPVTGSGIDEPRGFAVHRQRR